MSASVGGTASAFDPASEGSVGLPSAGEVGLLPMGASVALTSIVYSSAALDPFLLGSVAIAANSTEIKQ